MKRLLDKLPILVALSWVVLCYNLVGYGSPPPQYLAFKSADFQEKTPTALASSPLMRHAAQRPVSSSILQRTDSKLWLSGFDTGLYAWFVVATSVFGLYFFSQGRRASGRQESNLQFRYIHTR